MTDAGWYQCTAISPAGTAITKCKVTVIRMCLIFFRKSINEFSFYLSSSIIRSWSICERFTTIWTATTV
jgi:hypothetical protein